VVDVLKFLRLLDEMATAGAIVRMTGLTIDDLSR
jgi:hypothetical protein